MQLLFIRHAESTGNRAQRLQGQADDQLSRHGKTQAQKLAQQLLAEAWQPSHVYSSPLRRATQTTQILLSHFDAHLCSRGKLVKLDELKEIHNGVFQGLTWQEAQDRYPALCCALETSLEWLPIPGGESLQAVCDRAHIFVHQLLTRHANTDKVWIVTHGGLLQFLIAQLLGCDRVWGLQIKPTALFEFRLDLSRWSLGDQNRFNTALWQIDRFNDTFHLGRLVQTVRKKEP